MISCEDPLFNTESDSPSESEAQEYANSDKADSDLEIELYSQIYYLENLDASVSTRSFQNDSVVEVNRISDIDSLHSPQSNEGLAHSVNQDTPGLVRFNHFYSSTPTESQKNDSISEAHASEAVVVTQVKRPKKGKIKKRKTSTSVTDPKVSKSSEDSGCAESVEVNSDNDDDGDTDESVICLESDEFCDSSTIMMNIKGEYVQSKEVIVLDSTVTSDEDFIDQNSALPDTSDSEDSLKLPLKASSSVGNQSVGDLWHIDHEDRFAHIKKRQIRYHEKRNSLCYNCRKKGHLIKDCTEPKETKCYICGGSHVWSICQQKMCGQCFEYGHGKYECRYRADEILCNLCKMRGHQMSECPDIWRRYHLTTSPDTIVKGSKETPAGVKKYCYNCGHEGHYGHECLRPRMSPDSFPTWPFIISYKNPSHYLKKYLKNKGEHSNASKYHDSYPRHKHNKKHKSRADELREVISQFSGKHQDNFKKSKNKHKDKKKLFNEDAEQYIPLFDGSGIHRSPSISKLGEGGHKNKKRKKKDLDRLYAFKRKKQKLNATV